MSRRDEVPPTLGLDEAARWLGISYESARRRAVRGQFPGAFQIGRVWRVSRRALLREIERLAGMTHEPPARRNRGEAPRSALAAPDMAPVALDGSTGRRALTNDRGRRFIAASEPIEGERSLVRRPRRN